MSVPDFFGNVCSFSFIHSVSRDPCAFLEPPVFLLYALIRLETAAATTVHPVDLLSGFVRRHCYVFSSTPTCLHSYAPPYSPSSTSTSLFRLFTLLQFRIDSSFLLLTPINPYSSSTSLPPQDGRDSNRGNVALDACDPKDSAHFRTHPRTIVPGHTRCSYAPSSCHKAPP